MSDYPEIEKVKSIGEPWNLVLAFTKWLFEESGYQIEFYDGYDGGTIFVSPEHLVADYFGVNLAKYNKEYDKALRRMLGL